MEWVLIALAAPLLWAVQAVAIRIMRTKAVLSSTAYIFMTAPASLVGLLVPVFFEVSFDMIGAAAAFLAGIIVFFAYWAYLKAMGMEEVSRVVTIVRANALFTLVIAIVFLSERLDAGEAAGFILIFIGAIIMSVKRTFGRLHLGIGTGITLLSAFLFAVSDNLLKYSTGIMDAWSVFFYREMAFFVMGAGMLIVPSFRNRIFPALKRRDFSIALAIEIIGVLGVLSQIIAMGIAPVSLVIVIEGFNPMFVLLLAALLSWKLPGLLREEVSGGVIIAKAAAIFLMLAGILLLA